MSESKGWIEFVRGCHSDQSEEVVAALIDALTHHSVRSLYSEPVITCSVDELEGRAAGYVVLYPGALASIGNLAFVQSPRWSGGESQEQEQERKIAMLVEVVKTLCDRAFQNGVELVQAISPLVPSRLAETGAPDFISLDTTRDAAMEKSGLVPVAKLVQMECPDIHAFPRLDESRSTFQEGDEIGIRAHDSMPYGIWSELVEATYEETLDVPELNGKRRIENTLQGYASSFGGTPSTWWSIHCKDKPIGCILLTPMGEQDCELTYVGLLPDWRGIGISKRAMNFVREWALRHNVDRITLAVDTRNVPAIRLYQACGFIVSRFVQAWIGFRN